MSDKSHPISSSPYRQLAAAEQAHANAVQTTVSGIADETALHQWASCKAAAIRTSGSANADELRFILDVVDRAAVMRLSPDAAAALSWRCRTAAQNALAVPGAEDVRMLRACLAALDSISDTPPHSTIALPAGAQQAEGEKPRAGRSKGIPLAEAEVLVREWLLKNAKDNPAAITRDAVAAGTGVSAGQVSKTAAWKAFAQQRKAESPAHCREVQLTDSMLTVAPGDDGRNTEAELAALIEEQFAEMAEETRRHGRRHRPS